MVASQVDHERADKDHRQPVREDFHRTDVGCGSSAKTLIAWKLDRLVLAMERLIETVKTLRGIGFRSLTESLDTTTARGRPAFHMFGALAEFEHSPTESAPRRVSTLRVALAAKGGRPPKLTEDDLEGLASRALVADPDIGNRASLRRPTGDALSIHFCRAKCASAHSR
jgi:DNA invertase Pin-like site-specific DNA recombinase